MNNTTHPSSHQAKHVPSLQLDHGYDVWALDPDKLARTVAGFFGDDIVKAIEEKRDAAHPDKVSAATATGRGPAGGADSQEGSGVVPAVALPERQVLKFSKADG